MILSDRSDLSADYVIVALLERGLPYFRLNSEDLSEADYSVQFSTDSAESVVTVFGRSLELDTVASVWFRRQFSPRTAHAVAPAQSRFADGELSALIEGLLPRHASRWIDDPDRVRLAERKLYQLRCANALGIRFPNTIVSSDIGELRAFAEAHSTGVVCKPMFRGLFQSGTELRSAYTRIASPAEFDALKDTRVFPTLLQQFIPKGRDLRVTVIGRSYFGVEIETDDGAVDWRLPDATARCRPIPIDSAIESACRSLLEHLGLTCGAFDFALSPEGQWYFLEVNPVGEWAWLDIELDLGIRDVLVDYLYQDI